MKRSSASINSRRLLLATILLLPTFLCAGEDFPPPQHRFLLGPTSGSDATVWVQSDGEALVRLELLDAQSGQWNPSQIVLTQPDTAYTALLGVSDLEPASKQVARLRVTGEPVDPLFALQTAPPTYSQESFSIAVVSGASTPAKIDAGQVEALLDAQNPIATIWLGGLSALDDSRWGSARGYASAHAQVRRSSFLRPIFTRTPNLATWGPTDYGPPGAGETLWSRQLARNAFDRYWPTPLARVGEERPNGVGGWVWRWGDVEIYFLDSQWRRTSPAEKAHPSILGDDQLTWLLDALQVSQARFHLLAIGEPLLASNSPAARADVESLQEQLRARKLPGLLILAGAPHSPGELSLALDERPKIYELAISGFRDPQFDEEKFLNYLRTPGSFVREPHIAFISFAGVNNHRYMRISVHNLNQQQIYAKQIPLSELAPHDPEE